MSTLDTIIEMARKSPKRIVLCEGGDLRVQEAARRAHDLGIAEVILVNDTCANRSGVQDTTYPSHHNPKQSPHKDALAEAYFQKRKHKGLSRERAAQEAELPHIYAALLVHTGLADGFVGGAVLPSSQIIKTLLQVIGQAPDQNLVSSFFLMLLKNAGTAEETPVIFADGGLLIEPDAQELCELAIASGRSFASLTGQTPRIAMLSFSTKGSANHPAAQKMADATAMVQARDPNLIIDGELQFDAAFVPEVAKAKAPQSVIEGRANVFIFPNLDAGNIGYKIAQRIGGAQAIGPILQGLARPANDLSRGASVQDVLHMIAVTVLQAQLRDQVENYR